ncbi:MAG: PKD domain-containing protein [Cryomorphaceae bacterium]
MKKLFLLPFLLLISVLGIAQSVQITGTVTNDGDPIADADVYIMTIVNDPESSDTVATAITDTNGFFDVTAELDGDSLFLFASSSSCPTLLYGFAIIEGEGYVDIECGASITEILYIGGYPLSGSGEEWYFYSSVFGEVESFNWTIDGTNFDTPDVTYQFPGPGTYSASLNVEMASGNTLSDEMEVNVIETPNCFALFFPFVDSLNTDQLVFINASIGEDLSYFWDFGDGNTSTEQFPMHQYEDSLDYEVCLTLTGEDCEDTFCLTLSPDNVFGLTGSGIIDGRNPSEAKDGNGFEFIVVPPPGDPLSTQYLEYDVELNTYPNPTNGNAFVNFNSEMSESAQLRVMDITGKMVLQKNININSGQNQLSLDFSQLRAGVYIMFFESASSQRGVTKVVIQ